METERIDPRTDPNYQEAKLLIKEFREINPDYDKYVHGAIQSTIVDEDDVVILQRLRKELEGFLNLKGVRFKTRKLAIEGIHAMIVMCLAFIFHRKIQASIQASMNELGHTERTNYLHKLLLEIKNRNRFKACRYLYRAFSKEFSISFHEYIDEVYELSEEELVGFLKTEYKYHKQYIGSTDDFIPANDEYARTLGQKVLLLHESTEVILRYLMIYQPFIALFSDINMAFSPNQMNIISSISAMNHSDSSYLVTINYSAEDFGIILI